MSFLQTIARWYLARATSSGSTNSSKNSNMKCAENVFDAHYLASEAMVLGNIVSLSGWSSKNLKRIDEKISVTISDLKRHKMDILDKITCWNMTILPKVNHILRCTPFNSAFAQAWKKKGVEFVGTPKYIGHNRLFVPRSRGGLGMMDIELHWNILVFSWYKRAKLVDFPWKIFYIKACEGKPQNHPKTSPWRELAPPEELLRIYWRGMGAAGPIDGNPEVRMPLSNKIREQLQLERINDVLTLRDTSHPGVIFLRNALRRAFKPQKSIPPLKEVFNVRNLVLKEDMRRTHPPFDLTHKMKTPESIYKNKQQYIMTSIFDPLLTSKQAYLKYRISFGLYYVGEGEICEICSEKKKKTLSHIFRDCSRLNRIWDLMDEVFEEVLKRKSSAEEKLYGMFPESNIHRIASKCIAKTSDYDRHNKIQEDRPPSIYGNCCT
eukprot:TRINITY_DN1016_c0_g1_i5.p1 TRINITY_DN1016_c0_g1~~TRINITY_DN1016_c0_g1_i5.p1  ORF type:complete len:436 (-),score=9.19 TRINITY_DN1016_c0_g1_i5:47-1354(-)